MWVMLAVVCYIISLRAAKQPRLEIERGHYLSTEEAFVCVKLEFASNTNVADFATRVSNGVERENTSPLNPNTDNG